MKEITLSKRRLKTLLQDNAKSAEAIDLIYVSDSSSGIKRIQKGEKFIYKLDNKRITDKEQLNRIRKLVIPPAWREVWICAHPNGHLQATGYDQLNRKQYKYHEGWNELRNQTKFAQLYEFGQYLPQIRKKLLKDLSQPDLSLTKVLATVVSLMLQTSIRIGNSSYEKMYGSFGLTTLKDQHVKIAGTEIKFSFKGKKGVYHNITLKSKKLAQIVKQCRDIPGKELFQYYDNAGSRKSIDSGQVNTYIKEIIGTRYTAKDFRTWTGTLHALKAFEMIGMANTVTETKKNIVTALDMVAKQLGNTRTVCKKYYVHPTLLDMYSNQTLAKYFNTKLPVADKNFSHTERLLLKILKAKSIGIILP
jgi:Topoisomerase IB